MKASIDIAARADSTETAHAVIEQIVAYAERCAGAGVYALCASWIDSTGFHYGLAKDCILVDPFAARELAELRKLTAKEIRDHLGRCLRLAIRDCEKQGGAIKALSASLLLDETDEANLYRQAEDQATAKALDNIGKGLPTVVPFMDRAVVPFISRLRIPGDQETETAIADIGKGLPTTI